MAVTLRNDPKCVATLWKVELKSFFGNGLEKLSCNGFSRCKVPVFYIGTQYILKQWIALKARSDWLLNLRISFAIHLRATRVGFALENIASV